MPWVQLWQKSLWCELVRVCHRYGNTCGDQITGTTGMGTVVDFGTLCTRTVVSQVCTGKLQYSENKSYSNTCFFLYFFSKLKVSHCDRTQYGCQLRVYLCFLPSSSQSHFHSASNNVSPSSIYQKLMDSAVLA